jgi:hypothetical protein
LFAFATSLVIVSIARRLTNSGGAWAAGILYLLLLPLLGGQGGQSPIFYNLFIAFAARLTLDAFQRGPTLGRALAAMALCGAAILVTPTSLFEGVAIGLAQLWALWRTDPRLAVLIPRAALMIAVALAPTAAAFGAYAAIGEARTMWDATVLSIFRKGPMVAADRFRDFSMILCALTVPLIIALGGLAREWRPAPDRAPVAFLAAWLGFAVIGFASVPYFFVHYGLPLAVPISVAAAALLGDARDGRTLFAFAAILPIILLPHQRPEAQRGNQELARMASDIGRVGLSGCLYVHNGPPHLYTATRACRATRFVFPDHLESEVEAKALPVVPEAEVERIFARRPTTIVTAPRLLYERNNRVAAIVERYLACRYVLHDDYQLGATQRATLWVLRADAPDACPLDHAPMNIIQPHGGN